MKKNFLVAALIFVSTSLSARHGRVEQGFADEVYNVVKELEENFASMTSRLESAFGFSEDTLRQRVQELDDKYLVKVEIPGIKKEDVEIRFDDGENALIVKAAVSEKEEVRSKKSFKKSTQFLSREAYVKFAKPVEGMKVHASYDHGLLTITVPKKKAHQAKERRKILIED